MVRGKRLELSRLAALEPKSSASYQFRHPRIGSEAGRIIHGLFADLPAVRPREGQPRSQQPSPFQPQFELRP